MPAQILPAGTYTFTVVADAGVLKIDIEGYEPHIQ
jgi:hypothetical protein